MSDLSSACERAMRDIERAARGQEGAAASPETAEHVGGCPRCQAALLVLIGSLEPLSAKSLDCDHCQADLPAFIDIAQVDANRAMAAFPHVQWHLWTCTDCALTYDLTLRLFAASEAGEMLPLPTPPVARPATAPSRLVHLGRALLNYLLPAMNGPALVTRGGHGSYVLHDDLDDPQAEPHLVIVADQRPQSLWRLQATAEPAPGGTLVLIAGGIRMAAPFDRQGMATIEAIPSEVMNNPDAPDLQISLVPEVESL